MVAVLRRVTIDELGWEVVKHILYRSSIIKLILIRIRLVVIVNVSQIQSYDLFSTAK